MMKIMIKDEITNLFSIYQDLNIEFVKDENFNFNYDERWFSPIDRTLRRELKSRFGPQIIFGLIQLIIKN